MILKLVLFCFFVSSLSQGITFPMVVEISRQVFFLTRIGWDLVDRLGSNFESINGIEEKLLNRITELSKNVDAIINRTDLYQRANLEKLSHMQSEILYEMRMNSFLNNIIDIETNYKLFKTYTAKNSNEGIEKYTLQDFAEQTVSHSEYSIYNTFLKMNVLILGNQSGQFMSRKGLFNMVNEHTSRSSTMCDISQSPSQLLINFFLLLQITQFKAFLMIEYSWMLLRLYNKGNFIKEGALLKNTFLDQMLEQTVELLHSLRMVRNSLWKCDPQDHVEEKTYTQVTNFLQGYIINEVDINPSGSCWQNCAYYSFTKQYDCYQNLFCADQPKCNGTIVGCRYHDSDMWVCHNPSYKNRLYDYVQFENNDVFGRETYCTKSTKASSWWRWLFWHCSYCFCYCDDASNSDRYFNLRPVTSDVENNRIITGLRFIKVNKVIHLQIQEGELTETSFVNRSTVSWRPVDSYHISDSNVKSDVDYHSLTWEYRAIDLDDLIVPKNYIVTGVKFRRLGGSLKLEIQATLFNHTTGKLIKPSYNSYWIGDDNINGNLRIPRTEVQLTKPDVPVRSHDGLPVVESVESSVDSKSGQFIKFQSSDDESDAGQSTVPFIDIQEVAPEPPVPLVGIGLYHKGRRYSGGFIAPKVFTYNNEKNIIHFKESLKHLAQP